MSNPVRVRFAPSPTGPLHIGGVRTALFNYLFARKKNGTFILRIEDTDQTRYVPGAEQYIIDSLLWLGLNYDEGPGIEGPCKPYRQSERKAIYRDYALHLVQSGHAYYAFDAPEKLEQLRKSYEQEKKVFSYDMHTRLSLDNALNLSSQEVNRRISSGEHYVIRFKMPESHEVKFNDLVRGEVLFNTNQLDDKVLFKSDGMPTYHLANVVDDYLMNISHVIRGEEWLSSTPLHILLYEGLGWSSRMPLFAHLPLILKPGGQGKLSKRDGDKMGFPVFPLQWTDPQSGEISSGYRETGYFPDAVINILSLLGWNPGTEQEIFSLDQLIQLFSIEQIGKAGARFDPEKAKWFNQQYLRQKSNDELANIFIPELKSKGIATDRQHIITIINAIKERAVFASDLWQQSKYFFIAPDDYDAKIMAKFWNPGSADILESVQKLIQTINPFTETEIDNQLKNFISSCQLNTGQIMNLLRLALVGTNTGAHLNTIIFLLGKDETVKRIGQLSEKQATE